MNETDIMPKSDGANNILDEFLKHAFFLEAKRLCLHLCNIFPAKIKSVPPALIKYYFKMPFLDIQLDLGKHILIECSHLKRETNSTN